MYLISTIKSFITIKEVMVVIGVICIFAFTFIHAVIHGRG